MALNFAITVLRRKEALNLFVKRLGQQFAQAEVIVGLGNRRTLYSTSSNANFIKFSKPSVTLQKFYSVKSVEQQQEVADFHNEHKVTIIGENVPDPYINIENSEFPDYIKDFLQKQGFTKPTIIQAQGWPVALSGRNFVGIAQTGTGKTLAYLLPAVVHIKEQEARNGLGPRVLILAPTRELARQIEQVAKDFNQLLGIKCACIYGGASRGQQANILERGVDIVIATPGRLNDFIVSKVTNLSRCTYVVLDEADRMLDMGFEPQIRQALEGVPKERQILMFSATWPKEVQYLAHDYLGKFVQVNVGSTELTANHNIQQHIHVCEMESKMDKFKSLMHQISSEGFTKLLVFANTKRFVDHLTLMLKRNGWRAEGIHGDKSQMQRDNIIRKFKTGQVKILVATEVAARGLDVDGVSHVINYDFPNSAEDYIHRIGRTGRSESKGASHTILTADDERIAKSLIEVLKEANQEVPTELEDMARAYSMSKNRSQQPKWQQRGNTNTYNRNNNTNRNSWNNNTNRNSWNNNPNRKWSRYQAQDEY